MKTAKLNQEWIDINQSIPVPKIDFINKKYLDIAYGYTSPLQTMDLYIPNEGEKPYPLVINVHGGGFMFCDKRDWHLYPLFYALERGFAVASINYRLSPQCRFPEHIHDVKMSIRFLKAFAEQYDIDKKNVFLWGTSAGGNMVSMVGTTWKSRLLEDLSMGYPSELCDVRGIAALCPLINMNTYQREMKALIGMEDDRIRRMAAMFHSYFGFIPGENDPRLDEASADYYSLCDIPPFYLQHGTHDWAVPASQSIAFAEAIQKVGKKDFVLDLIEGAGHAGGGPEFLERKNIIPIIAFFEKNKLMDR